MYSLNNISIHYSGSYLFRNISFLINQRDRIGLVGKNGAGKTTLLKILTKEITPEKGDVVIPQDRTLGYLPQVMDIFSKETVFNEALKAFKEALDVERKIHTLTEELTTIEDFYHVRYIRILEDLAFLTERFRIIGGPNKEAETERVLLGLGFRREDFNRPMNEFSGGWQMRVELARILLRRPDLLLLDEPTNHLDIESIQWLEEFLINYEGAVILVSHDRALLDNVTNRTIEIVMGKLYDYKLNYSGYVIQREQQMDTQLSALSNQQQQIAQIQRFIERFRYKNTKAKQVQSRIKMLDKMEKIEVDEIDISSIHFTFPPAPRSGKVVFEAKSVSKSYGENLVLMDIDLAVIRKEAIAFVGRNGEGKTTLSRIIVGELEHKGEAGLGYNVKMGYYAQNQAELLNPEKTVFQTIDDVATGEMRTRVRGVLGGFLFSGDSIDKKVKVLSGGEKSRLALARLLMTPVSLLVLDEPTNHLDMQSKDILKNALLSYDGTMIIVSHDRDFLQGLTNKVIEFRNKKIYQYLGTVYDYLDSRKIASLKELEKAKKQNDLKERNIPPSENKMRYEKRKEMDREYRRIRSKVTECEEEIHILEKELEVMNTILSNPDTHFDKIGGDDFYSRYGLLKQRHHDLMGDWEEWQISLEEMDRKIKEI